MQCCRRGVHREREPRADGLRKGRFERRHTRPRRQPGKQRDEPGCQHQTRERAGLPSRTRASVEPALATLGGPLFRGQPLGFGLLCASLVLAIITLARGGSGKVAAIVAIVAHFRLARRTRWIARVAAGDSGVCALVGGDAGIGKSRLLLEIGALARASAWVRSPPCLRAGSK